MFDDRVSLASGALAPVAGLGSVLLATLLSPSFAWTGSALSDLGRAGEPTALLFNGGLVLTALLVFGFLPALWRAARNPLHRLGTVLYGLAAAALGLVGVFPTPTAPHFPAALSFFALLSVSLWLLGAGSLRDGNRRFGAGGVLLGTLNIAGWVAWAATGDLLRPGLALPEVVGSVVLAGWTLWAVARLR